MKRVSVLFGGVALLAGLGSAADPTWPSMIDEMEDLMYLTTGYRNRGFADPVVPCSKPPAGTSGRTASAEWIRTAFHDAAPGSVYSGIGGADGSLMFETARSENIGAAFPTTMGVLAQFYNSKASAADLIALGLYTSTRSCGGPVVPVRVGRIDATEAGPIGVPEPQNDVGTLVNQLGRLGFEYDEAIIVTICGHTVGGVHSVNFPTIVTAPADGSDKYVLDDSTPFVFDNRIVVEWLAGNTTDPMAVGPSVASKRNSDAKMFLYDKNVTARNIADPAVFAQRCAATFQKMIEVVPTGVTLTDPMAPYEVKPSFLQLTLLDGGATMKFTGEIRVRTTVRTQAQIASVQLAYLDRNGGKTCGSCTIMTSFVGSGGGFDDSFAFYSFSATIDSTSSISAFNVLVNLVGGSSETHDNNGVGYPIQDNIMLQIPQSCVGLASDANGNKAMTVVAAVRNTLNSASIQTTTTQGRSVAFPLLVNATQSMTSGQSVGPYTLYTATVAIPASQAATAKFDLLSGTFGDTFKSAGSLGNTCGTLSGGSSSTSSSTSSTTTSTSSVISSTSSTTSTTSTSSSSTSTTSSSTSSSATATGWTRLGCYADNVNGRALPNGMAVIGGSSNMTNENCQAAALAAGYKYAGTEYSGECWAGSAVINGGGPASDGDAKCTMACNGASAENCGGPDRLNMYAFGVAAATSSSTSSSSSSSTTSSATTTSASTTSTSTSTSASTSTTSSTAIATAAGWTAVGCYADLVNNNGRALEYGMNVPGGSSNMTNYNCQKAAQAAGYTYAGTEYSGECWAGNTFANGGGPASDGNAQCNMKCNGNINEICGGPSRLTVYQFGVSNVVGSSSSSSTTSSTSSSTSSTSSTTSKPTTTTSSTTTSSTSITSTTTSKPTTSSTSTSTSTTLSTSTAASTSSTATPTGWHYLGCYSDLTPPTNKRSLSYSLSTLGGSSNMTNSNCISAATKSGYVYAGTEYSGECWAGNQLMNGAAIASGSNDVDRGCSMKCNGNSSEICGGSKRISLWGFGGVSGVAVS